MSGGVSGAMVAAERTTSARGRDREVEGSLPWSLNKRSSTRYHQRHSALESTRKDHRHNLQHQRAELKEAIKQLEAAGMKVAKETAPWFLIDPRPGNSASKLLVVWDSITSFSLIFTAIASPFEVSFLNESCVDYLFVVNRFVDCVFLVDTLLQFFLVYQDAEGWVKDPKRIAHRYLTSWFTIDFLSVMVAFIDIYSVAVGCGAAEGEGAASQLSLLRMFRVLRLIKLARLARASKVVQRWQAKLNLDYAQTALARCVVMISIIVHWSACIWALQVSFASLPLSHTWMGDDGYCVPQILATNQTDTAEWADAQRFAHFTYGMDLSEWVEGVSTLSEDTQKYICVPPSGLYTASVYWAVMTITSIGYGDLTPTSRNSLEQLVAAFLMLIGGLTWGYVIATFAGLLATMSPATTEHRVTLDNLNRFLTRNNIDADLEQRLRDYFSRTGHLQTAQADSGLLEKMPISLQGEVVTHVHDKWMQNIPYLSRPETRTGDFVSEFVSAMKPKIFPPSDTVRGARLYVVYKGAAVFGGSSLTKGMIWGEDCVLEAEYLRSRNSARAAGFLETFSISREPLLDIITHHPEAHAAVRRYTLVITFRRMLVLAWKAKRRPMMVEELVRVYPTTLGPRLMKFLHALGDAPLAKTIAPWAAVPAWADSGNPVMSTWLRRGMTGPSPTRDLGGRSFSKPAKLVDFHEDIADDLHIVSGDQRLVKESEKVARRRKGAAPASSANAPTGVLQAVLGGAPAAAPPGAGLQLSGESPAASRTQAAAGGAGGAGGSLQRCRQKRRANPQGLAGSAASRTAERMEQKEAMAAASVDKSAELLSSLAAFKKDILEQQQSQQALLQGLSEEVSWLRAERVAATADRAQGSASNEVVPPTLDARTRSGERAAPVAPYGTTYGATTGERTQASNTHVCVCVHGASGSEPSAWQGGPFDA